MLNILLSGDGGQGVQLLSYVLCHAMIKNGYSVSHIPNYGLEQRGGVSLGFIRVAEGNESIAYPKFSKADYLLIISDQARERTSSFVGESTFVIDKKDYTEDLKEKDVFSQNVNIYFLRILSNIFKEKGLVKEDDVFEILEGKLGKKQNWEEVKRVFALDIDLK